MKILYIHQYFSTPRGAVGTRSYEFAKRLCAAGHAVTVICGQSHLTDTPPEVDGIRVIALPVAVSNRDGFLRRIVGFLRYAVWTVWYVFRVDHDLVYASSTPLTVGIPALVSKVVRRRRMIFEVRDLWPELPVAMGVLRNPLLIGLLRWFEGLCYRRADACVGLSPGIVKGILERCPGKRVEMIPNGCDLTLFEPRERGDGGGYRPLASGGKPRFRAIFCGAHGRANGLESVLDAARELRERGDEAVELVFVGDGQLKPGLVEKVQRESLENCVFVDPVPKEEMSRMLREANAGLMILADVPAFRYGTSPNKFFDYLAAGLPVLCNYPGWVSDLITEHECGVAVRPGDGKAFADALMQMQNDPEGLLRMGRNARRLAEDEFSRDHLFGLLLGLVDKI